MSAPRLSLEDIHVTFRRPRRGWHAPAEVRAVDGASLELHAGRTLALLGESGSGKSTLARVAAGLQRPARGIVRDEGRAVAGVRPRFVQLVFQDASAALDPRLTVRRALAEPLEILRAADVEARVAAGLARVELSEELLDRTPDRLSGGQKARVGLARALLVEPQVLLLDEPFSALDVSVAAKLWATIADWQRASGAAILLVTHDARAALAVASEVAVMQAGRIVERRPADGLPETAEHAYTRALLAASPGLRVTSARESG